MRLPLLVAAVVILAGCGGVERTVEVEPAQPTLRRNAPVVAPVYAHPPQAVLAACVLACDSYCHDLPQEVDEQAMTLQVYDQNAWTGSIPLSISLVDLGDGCTRMDMVAGESPDFVGDEVQLQRKRMRGFAEHVDRHLRMAAALNAAQDKMAESDTSGSGASSGTSRP